MAVFDIGSGEQFRRQDSLIPKSFAISATGASPRRATATASSRKFLGWRLGMMYDLSRGALRHHRSDATYSCSRPHSVLNPCRITKRYTTPRGYPAWPHHQTGAAPL